MPCAKVSNQVRARSALDSVAEHQVRPNRGGQVRTRDRRVGFRQRRRLARGGGGLRWREEEEPCDDILLYEQREDGRDCRIHRKQQQAETEERLADQLARSAAAGAPRRRNHGCATQDHGDVLDDYEEGERARGRAVGCQPLCERRTQ